MKETRMKVTCNLVFIILVILLTITLGAQQKKREGAPCTDKYHNMTLEGHNISGCAEEAWDILLDYRDNITRTISVTEDGVHTVTTSPEQMVAEAIKKHVWQMKKYVEEREALNTCDPLFSAVYDNTDVLLSIADLPTGAAVNVTSISRCTANILQYHALVFSKFIVYGREEMDDCNYPSLPECALPKCTQGQPKAVSSTFIASTVVIAVTVIIFGAFFFKKYFMNRRATPAPFNRLETNDSL